MLNRHLLTRRTFLKTSVGTIAAFASGGISELSQTAEATHDLANFHHDFFNEQNFPSVIERQPGLKLVRDNTRLLLVFKDRPSIAKVTAFLATANLILEELAGETSLLPNARINHSQRHFWVRRNQSQLEDQPITDQTYKVLAKALDQSILHWVGPVHRYPGTKGQDGLLCPSPNVLLLKLNLKPDSKIPHELKKLLDTDNLEENPERSKYLHPFRYFALKDAGNRTVYRFHQQALAGEFPFVVESRLENSPLVDPRAMPPDDPYYGSGNSGQWNLRTIHAPDGWSICSGRRDVLIFVIDAGVDTVDDRLSDPSLPGPHPDLRFAHPGINVVTKDDIADIDRGERLGVEHGTWCAGIASAITNNGQGIAGLVGGALGPADHNNGCQIYPLVFYDGGIEHVKSDIQVAEAFRFAVRVHKKELSPADPGYIGSTVAGSVVSFSYAQTVAWDPAIMDPAINDAFSAGIVICVSSGNSDVGTVRYPASHQNVIACGATDKDNNRVEKANGFTWGSSYGNELSVVAPGVDIPSTDPQDDAPGAIRGEDDSINGPYTLTFWGTSAAAPHVAGLAALLLSKFPYLTPSAIRTIIERTAAKVGRHATGCPPRYPVNRPNGTWHQEMGYGLINVVDALNYPADVMIRDTLSDTGAEPSSGVYWESPDIVIRPNPADAFIDSDAVVKGQDNYLFVRLTNNGPGIARNVAVEARIVPYVGVGLTYPYDWKINPLHIQPIPLTGSIQEVHPGISNQVIAKFRILKADVDTLWDWSQTYRWHPCLLAEVTADNDFKYLTAPALEPGSPTRQRNNLGQRNLTVVAAQPASVILFPFIMGSAGAGAGAWRSSILHIDRTLLPSDIPITLDLDPEDAPFSKAGTTSTVGDVSVWGGKFIKEDGRRTVLLGQRKTLLSVGAKPEERYRFLLKIEIPKQARKGKDAYTLHISMVNAKKKTTVGGATLIISVA